MLKGLFSPDAQESEMFHRTFNCQLKTYHHKQNHHVYGSQISCSEEKSKPTSQKMQGRMKLEMKFPKERMPTLSEEQTSVLSSSYAWMIFPEQSESAGASNCPSEVSTACNSDSSHIQLSARQNPNLTEH